MLLFLIKRYKRRVYLVGGISVAAGLAAVLFPVRESPLTVFQLELDWVEALVHLIAIALLIVLEITLFIGLNRLQR